MLRRGLSLLFDVQIALVHLATDDLYFRPFALQKMRADDFHPLGQHPAGPRGGSAGQRLATRPRDGYY